MLVIIDVIFQHTNLMQKKFKRLLSSQMTFNYRLWKFLPPRNKKEIFKVFFKEKAKQVDRLICKNVQRLRSTVVKGWGLFLFLGWKKQKGINGPFTEIKGVDFPFSSTRNFIITANHTLIHVYRLQILLNSRMSQDIFRLNIDETYRDWEGAIRIADDITVYGKNDTEHDLHLHETMERTMKAGIKLSDENCVIKTKECNFFILLYTPDGVKSSSDKVQLIKNLDWTTQRHEGASHHAWQVAWTKHPKRRSS